MNLFIGLALIFGFTFLVFIVSMTNAPQDPEEKEIDVPKRAKKNKSTKKVREHTDDRW